MTDSKYALFSGLSHTVRARDFDTKRPRNVNDADIFPSATEPFQDREGPTEMIFCLLNYRVAKYIIESPGFETMVMIPEGDSAEGNSGPTEEQLTAYRRGFEQLGNDIIEMLDKHCDPTAGPVHEMTIRMRHDILNRFTEVITPPKSSPEWGGEVRSAKDNTFKVAIGSLEQNESHYMSAKDKGFAWFTLLHFQLDIFVYLAVQLCHRTEGSLVERAWRQVNVVYSFHPELFDVTNKTHATLAVYILKAWRKREKVIFDRTGQAPETPFYVEKLRACMPNDDYKTEPTPPNPYTPVSLTGLHASPSAPDGTLDQFLGYYDGSGIDWDMFGSPAVESGHGMPFGTFGMGSTGGW